jgi:hypothetical protein
MVHRTIQPPSLPVLLNVASEFDDSVFEAIGSILASPSSVDLSDSGFSELSSTTGVSEENLRYFMSFVSFLFTQVENVDRSDVRPMLEDFLNGVSELDDISRLASKFEELLQHRSAYDQAAKQARLTRGFLPFLLEASSFVDRRNDFERNSDNKLTGATVAEISIVQLMLTTDARNEAEKHIVVQLDKAGLEILENAISEIKQKIEILESGK